MHILEVGKPYPAKLPESVQYNFRGGQHELLMVMRDLSEEDIADVRKGECEFAVVWNLGMIFFLYRFGKAIPWSDAPYSWWLVPESERTIPRPPASEDERALLMIILVSAEDGIVRVLRTVTLSQEMTKWLHDCIAQQAHGGWCGTAAHDNSIRNVYAIYPASAMMIDIADVRCKGGD